MALASERTSSDIRFLEEDESREFFDAQAQRLMGMSGDEFLRRYDAGEFEAIIDDPKHRGIMMLAMLSPFGR